ncbi:cupin domain-containing protein [Bradymonas sediminis]|uniref:Cupin n=1 Tax=Bradymonas sediminis TaxID=1548548 RepID=A0A2Z4FR43_9DELT|nr:cupin domain-containing protein [Bradymonas sediminis]AWV91420.1 cupin [Bradymonas sediminis]TDP75973.1 cupin domain [Bradymonas sediminis]
MAAKIGAQKLGCRLTVVPPGKKAWPFHSHHANEEMFLILEGTGSYRLGQETYPIKAGDLLSAPVGGAETAHQIINDSTAPLKYLAMSTMHEPDIMEYPDSKKFGVFAGSAPGGAKADRRFSAFAFLDDTVGYWEDEE